MSRPAEHPTAAPFVPEDRSSIERLRHAAGSCEGCGLYAAASQTVFGEGPPDAPLMMVGEVPGDQEDRLGKPFVGPAGQLLDRALDAAGISRADAYVTNAVKHFSFIERGKRRIHQTPKTIEIRACAPWLDAEIETVEPRVIVALGATAAKAMLGGDFRITKDRGRAVRGPRGIVTIATAHPSAILRAEPDRQEQDFAALVADLRVVAKHLADANVPIDDEAPRPGEGDGALDLFHPATERENEDRSNDEARSPESEPAMLSLFGDGAP